MTPSKTIHFEENGGSIVSDITLPVGTTIGVPTEPTREGYSFAGWYSDVLFTIEYAFSTMPTEDVTLYAKWAINQYILEFRDSDGTVLQTTTYDFDSNLASHLNPIDPTKVGYTFTGWNGDLPATMPAANVIITATYTINQYTIAFESNDGSAVTEITQDYGTVVAQPANPTKTGYAFSGWYQDEGLTVPYSFTTMPAEDITLYAKWTAETGEDDPSDYTYTLLANDTYEITGYIGSNTALITPSSYLGKTVTSIGNLAFYNCSSILQITVADSVTKIGEGAFTNCTGLLSVFISLSVNTIGNAVFSGCISLLTIAVDEDNLLYSSENGVLYNQQKSVLISYPSGKSETDFQIPGSVLVIGNGAFSSCIYLENIMIPAGVTSIGNMAFYSCLALLSINIPNQLTSIGEGAFLYCSSLTSIIIPASVTIMGDWAFYGCSSVTIYARAASKPSGWATDWNPGQRPVVWSYAG